MAKIAYNSFGWYIIIINGGTVIEKYGPFSNEEVAREWVVHLRLL